MSTTYPTARRKETTRGIIYVTVVPREGMLLPLPTTRRRRYETDRKTVSTWSGRYIAGVHAIPEHRRVTAIDVFVELTAGATNILNSFAGVHMDAEGGR